MPKKKQLTWEDFPRKKDKLAIVGFASTKDLTPWNDEEYEIFSLNEGYYFDWFERTPDRWLQIHPKWDWIKDNNQNDPNHPHWLMNKSAKCIRCGGTGFLTRKDQEGKEIQVDCDAKGCDKGTYKPLKNRNGFPIYMQEAYPEVPNAVKFPLDEIHKRFFGDKVDDMYFTSSAAYMLGLGMLLEYKQIDLYGFEMGTTSEYHYQRANFEWMVGVAQGLGYKIVIPKRSPILKGELYGYENMQQGYRQNLEMRKAFLKSKHEASKANMWKLAGTVENLKVLYEKEKKFIEPYLGKSMQDYHNALALVNAYEGAMSEVDNLTNLYDGYFKGGVESTRSDEELVKEFVHSEYENE